MAAARLFHLSDLHLALRPRQVDPLTLASPSHGPLPSGWSLAWQSSYHPGALLSAIDHVHNATPADAVVVTGDIATSGTIEDLVIGAAVLQQPPVKGFYANHPGAPRLVPAGSVLPTLQRQPVLWIPGNHDRYQAAGGVPWAPGSTLFDSKPGWKVCGGVNGPRVTGPHFFGAQRQLVILGIDATLGSMSEASPPLGFLAEGVVRAADLDELTSVTPAPSPGKFILWLVHWPPEYPPHLAKPFHELKNEATLLQAAQAAGVDLILSGHTHRDAVYVSSVGVPVACCGTTSQTIGGSPHTLFELELQRAGSVFSARIDRWQFDASSVAFRRRGGWRLAGGTVAQLP